MLVLLLFSTLVTADGIIMIRKNFNRMSNRGGRMTAHPETIWFPSPRRSKLAPFTRESHTMMVSAAPAQFELVLVYAVSTSVQ